MYLRMSLLLICMLCGTCVPENSPSPVCLKCGGVCRTRVPHQYMVADELGISHGLLSQWKSKSDRFVAQVAKLGALRKVHDGPRRALHAEEEALYMSFINKRKNIGFPIDHFGLWPKCIVF